MSGPDTSFRAQAIAKIQTMQEAITRSLEQVEGAEFHRDQWTRQDGNGHGQSNIIQRGNVFEKGGVNFTTLELPLNKGIAEAMSARGKTIDMAALEQYRIFAAGVSFVIHPFNPHVPTVHGNYRFMEVTKGSEVIDWWFAGGSDLTPYYLYEEDCVLFHTQLKTACDTLGPEVYPKYKKWCDEYFFIRHRGVSRGIGGIFFDDVNIYERPLLLAFIGNCAQAFVDSYPVIASRRKDIASTDAERYWQEIRHGHYVEFNMVYDRGTKFGLQTPDANIEAVLMPMPTTARWEYKHQVEPGSREAALVEVLTHPREWAN